MSAIRIIESTGSAGTIQVSDGQGGFSSSTTFNFLTGSNDLIISGALFVTTGNLIIDSSQVLILSGGGSTSTNESGYADVNFFVSGSKDSRATSTRGTALFGGDLVVSGTLYAEKQVIEVDEYSTGSLHVSGSLFVQRVTDLKDNLFVTGTIYGNATIGDSEDGSYTDGLFTDFITTTPVGTAVDRFNEILKALAPSPAPDLDDIDCDDTGQDGNLSFGTSNTISGYTNVSAIGNLSAVDVNGLYEASSVSNDLRQGLFDGTTVINGTLNADVAADGVNYGAYAFGEGKTGFVILQLNGSNILSASISIDDLPITTSSAGGSILTINSASAAHFTDGTTLDVFMHRSGTYSIAADDQNNGLNYSRVIHRRGSTMADISNDITTNYVEWVNDNNANALAAAGSAFDTLVMTGDVRLSGVKYFTGGSAQYRVRVTNSYRNVYTTSNITFTDTNCTIAAQAMPTINTGGGEDENKVLHITGSATINANDLLNESITAKVNVAHPLKSNLSNAGSKSISNILMWTYSNNSTVLVETFRRENFRLISGSYDAQADVTNNSNTWDSDTHVSGSNTGYADGNIYYNQRLYTPTQGANGSNFAGITNGPVGNVNYSGLNSGTKTFYRYFQNDTGGSKTGFSIVINGSGTIVSIGTALSTSNLKVYVKLPTTTAGQATGWMDLASAFASGQVADNDGCLEGTFDSTLNATNTATFGTQFVADNEYVMIKIVVDASFTGYVSKITVSWS